jgi:hypothetical protein
VGGAPAWREVGVTVPRQSGKTQLVWAWCVARCVAWPRPQHIAWTGQTGADARKKWLDELLPTLRRSPLFGLVEAVNVAMGAEAVRFRNGSILRLLSVSPSSGHGITLDGAVLDELWADEDMRREQMLRPAMVTRADAQIWWVSTAGTPASVVLARKVEQGRKAVEEGLATGVAYFEWSADPARWDPDDEAQWWACMPAMGHLVTPEVVRAERAGMDPEEFRRAYGNLPSRALAAGIPEGRWAAVCDPEAAPAGELTWAVEVAMDRASACIAVSDGEAVELVEHRAGTGWVVGRVAELVEHHGGEVVLDGTGPAGALADMLPGARRLTSRDVLDAEDAFLAAVLEARVRVRPDVGLDKAARGVVQRQVGDRWCWSRRHSATEVAPLVAAALAWWAASRRAVATRRVDPVAQVW